MIRIIQRLLDRLIIIIRPHRVSALVTLTITHGDRLAIRRRLRRYVS